jgi:metal-responsive CopG/Arc/MetJ family transcriptional regulator
MGTKGAKMAKILVTMPDDFLNRIDKIAGSEQRTRSELIREALRAYMRRMVAMNPQKATENANTLEALLG